MIFARKINKIPQFYTIFARQMPEFFIIIARKIFFPKFGGYVPPASPSPTPMIPTGCGWRKNIYGNKSPKRAF